MEQTSVSDAIRFILIGFVGFFYFSFLFPETSAKVIKDIGAIPLTGCALSGGAAFFFLYDALVLPIIHRLKDLSCGPEESYRIRLKRMFPEYRLTSLEAEYLYVSVLRNKFGWKDVPDLVVYTSGIHFMYMSSFLAGIFATIALALGNYDKIAAFLAISILAAFVGFRLDRRVEKMETALLFDADIAMLRPAVAKAFPKRAPVANQAAFGDNIEHITLEYLKGAPLTDISPHLRVVADRIDEHRRAKQGFTPHELFVQCLELGLCYACIELVLWVCDNSGVVTGVALKRRDIEDQGWHGKLTIAGVAIRPFDSLVQAQERLLEEIASDETMKSLLRGAFNDSPFIEVHREDTDTQVEGRRVNCLTAVYAKIVNRTDISMLAAGFEFVPLSSAGDAAIVDHHRETLNAMQTKVGGNAT
ncbi:MAG: hypothetical protein FP814_06085 [Desulfobacterium sp.]|nr:hypothetical protein [Desulfobacterium sp.]MBU3948654.1 hypothetical protein [Pseudomonadota bacterium]MBU4009159.1 hypothetical protein [Pseudomonadota bacterium]MBU4036552.1 hypothetical protein [Pseudomonadota bacterium]